MPIYHHYHGDLKSSSISTWDQIGLDQPPPESPDLHSHSGVVGDADNDASQNRSGSAEVIIAAREEKTLVKAGVAGVQKEENNQDLRLVRNINEAGTSAEVGASARGKWTGNVVIATDGGLRARQLRRLVLLTPPPFLAAVFPWNRGGDGED
ncbi:hypothetical protein PIB30_028184 [Stylosanthes scabra]|uniref:Uncharacterized protein n=1 Tax=Stylosanthes scabra TaxID=79078 RepID=A0ABU6QAE3_9FABA|nr:hypothetical protein [Stylosanthes scabra]